MYMDGVLDAVEMLQEHERSMCTMFIAMSYRQGSNVKQVLSSQTVSFTHLWVSKEGILLSSIIKDQFIFRIPRPA